MRPILLTTSKLRNRARNHAHNFFYQKSRIRFCHATAGKSAKIYFYSVHFPSFFAICSCDCLKRLFWHALLSWREKGNKTFPRICTPCNSWNPFPPIINASACVEIAENFVLFPSSRTAQTATRGKIRMLHRKFFLTEGGWHLLGGGGGGANNFRNITLLRSFRACETPFHEKQKYPQTNPKRQIRRMLLFFSLSAFFFALFCFLGINKGYEHFRFVSTFCSGIDWSGGMYFFLVPNYSVYLLAKES